MFDPKLVDEMLIKPKPLYSHFIYAHTHDTGYAQRFLVDKIFGKTNHK